MSIESLSKNIMVNKQTYSKYCLQQVTQWRLRHKHYANVFGRCMAACPVQIVDFHDSINPAALMHRVTLFLTFVMFRTHPAKRRTPQANGKAQKFARRMSHNGISS